MRPCCFKNECEPGQIMMRDRLIQTQGGGCWHFVPRPRILDLKQERGPRFPGVDRENEQSSVLDMWQTELRITINTYSRILRSIERINPKHPSTTPQTTKEKPLRQDQNSPIANKTQPHRERKPNNDNPNTITHVLEPSEVIAPLFTPDKTSQMSQTLLRYLGHNTSSTQDNAGYESRRILTKMT